VEEMIKRVTHGAIGAIGVCIWPSALLMRFCAPVFSEELSCICWL